MVLSYAEQNYLQCRHHFYISDLFCIVLSSIQSFPYIYHLCLAIAQLTGHAYQAIVSGRQGKVTPV